MEVCSQTAVSNYFTNLLVSRLAFVEFTSESIFLSHSVHQQGLSVMMSAYCTLLVALVVMSTRVVIRLKYFSSLINGLLSINYPILLRD